MFDASLTKKCFMPPFSQPCIIFVQHVLESNPTPFGSLDGIYGEWVEGHSLPFIRF
jgi:hypothetical protein